MKNLESLTAEVSRMLMTNLQEFCEKENNEELTPELSSKMILSTKNLISDIGKLILETFFESYDTTDATIQHKGEVYRWKYKKPRDFITCLGKLRISRNVYQKDRGEKSIAPLDRKWNMEHEYLSPEVQECILYTCAHNTPADV